MKNYFNKELVMTKEDNEDFDSPTNFFQSVITIILILMLK